MLAVALGSLLLFAVLAFATTEQWSLTTFQVGIFILGIWCASRRSLRWHRLGFALAGVVAVAAVQLLAGTTVYRFATLNALVNWAAYFVLFLVSLRALADPGIRRSFLQATLYGGVAIAVLATVQYFTSDGAIYWVFHVSAGRPFGPFVNPDHYAVFIELILPLAIYEAQRDRSKLWLHTAIVGALYASVIASASRAGVALATLEILVLPWLGRRSSFAGKVIMLSVAFAGIASLVVGPDVIWKRFQDKDPLRYRRQIAVSTVQMIRQRPWLGFGLGTYVDVYPEFASFDLGLTVDHAHNDWAEWTAEGGIPMLLLMLGIVAVSFRPALRSGWALGIYAVFLHSLVDFPLQIPAIAALLFTFLAALCSEECSLRRPVPEPLIRCESRSAPALTLGLSDTKGFIAAPGNLRLEIVRGNSRPA
jgi:O-antigen ligase